MTRRRAWGLAALAAAVWTAGCAGEGDIDSIDGVQDDVGRTVSTETPRTRVISLVPGLTETLLVLGAGPLLVARTRYDLDPRLESLPSVGGGLDPSLEVLVALEPDLVVAWPDRDARSLGSVLVELGVPVYSAETQTLADYRRHTRNLGSLLGEVAAAEAVIADFDAALTDLGVRLAGVAAPSVFFVVWHDPPQTAGPGTFPDRLLSMAGARNVFDDAAAQWPVVSLEEIVRRQPDYVLVTDGQTDSATPDAAQTVAEGGSRTTTPIRSEPGPSFLYERPGWRDLTAVTEGRVLTVGEDLFSRPGPRVAEAARALARVLHPTRFP